MNNSAWAYSINGFNEGITNYNSVITNLFFVEQGSKGYWTYFEGKNTF